MNFTWTKSVLENVMPVMGLGVIIMLTKDRPKVRLQAITLPNLNEDISSAESMIDVVLDVQ